jgi:ketosteroid isomerase-like protein
MPATLKHTPLLLLCSVLVGACSGGTQTLTDAQRDTVTAEVTATMTQLLEAMNAHEPDRVMSFYTDAPEFLALTCTSYISGGTTFKAMTGPFYGPKRGTAFGHRVVGVQVLSPTAAVVSLSGSSSLAPALFWTRVLVNQDGRWLITYEHQSWPGCSDPPAPHPYTSPGDSSGLEPGGVTN